jgi:hypothetical protein
MATNRATIPPKTVATFKAGENSLVVIWAKMFGSTVVLSNVQR